MIYLVIFIVWVVLSLIATVIDEYRRSKVKYGEFNPNAGPF